MYRYKIVSRASSVGWWSSKLSCCKAIHVVFF